MSRAVFLCLMAVAGVALMWFTIDVFFVSWKPKCQPSPKVRCQWVDSGKTATVADQWDQNAFIVAVMFGLSVFLIVAPVFLAIRDVLRRRDESFEAQLRGSDPPRS
ncbi:MULTISPECIES: hypothetical protein [unclassified Amycolatopsis]|uniref:hypothetical protein n=1 Tax=unclassified Amycolatopsis TaxID=2618356 RepID=UPI00106DE74F|nr:MULTISPECIES: hypothetical protein [unclassified Amycolatopsis]